MLMFLLYIYLAIGLLLFGVTTFRILMALIKDTVIGWHLCIPNYFLTMFLSILFMGFHSLIWPFCLKTFYCMIFDKEVDDKEVADE